MPGQRDAICKPQIVTCTSDPLAVAVWTNNKTHNLSTPQVGGKPSDGSGCSWLREAFPVGSSLETVVSWGVYFLKTWQNLQLQTTERKMQVVFVVVFLGVSGNCSLELSFSLRNWMWVEKEWRQWQRKKCQLTFLALQALREVWIGLSEFRIKSLQGSSFFDVSFRGLKVPIEISFLFNLFALITFFQLTAQVNQFRNVKGAPFWPMKP